MPQVPDSPPQTVAVIDYGMGNLHSASKALEHVAPDNTQVLVTSDPNIIVNADRVVLPGVGAIRDCVGEIKRLGLDKVIFDVINKKTPLLGICVGLQLLLQHSEENGGVEALGAFEGSVRLFNPPESESQGSEKLKVPHMGWNQVEVNDHPMWNNIPNLSRFYFVHSYYVEAGQTEEVAGWCDYGVRFAAALHRENVFAVQFHPEKSHPMGLVLLENFLKWNP